MGISFQSSNSLVLRVFFFYYLKPIFIRNTVIIGEITENSNAQSQALVTISSSLAKIDNITQQNAASSEEAAAASEELSAQAEEMKGMVNQFQTMIKGG